MEYWNKTIVLENLIKDGIITLDRGRVISSIDLMKYPGDYPVYSSSAQKNGYFGSFDLYDFDEELITWSVDGGGYFFYRPKHKFSVTNVSGIMRIIKSDKYDYKFLYYLLVYQHKNQIFDYVDKAHPSVIKKRYFIPEIQLTEQTQIATILSKVDEAITQTEQLIAKYTRIKTGLMQDLLTKGIDENGNIRSEETHEFKDSPLGRIPKEWEDVKVSDLGAWKGGKTPRKSNKKYWEGAKNLWFSSKDIVSNLLSDSFYKISDAAISETNQTLFPAYRSLIFVFRSGILRHTFPVARSEKEFSINQDIKALIPNRKYQSEFLYYFFKSIEPVILSSFVKAGTTVESIDGRAFFDLPIGIPTEKEQIRIQSVLLQLDVKLKHSNNQLSKLQSLKTGLMQDLLSGKVRVNHLIKETANL